MLEAAPLPDYVSEPSVLICADGEAGARAAMAAVDASRGRVIAQAGIAEAIARYREQAGIDLIIIEAAADHGEPLDDLLEAVTRDAADGATAALIVTNLATLDLVERYDRPGVQLLVQPEPGQREVAIQTALAASGLRLHDVRETAAERLKTLSEEVERIARVLANLSASQPAAPLLRTTESTAIVLDGEADAAMVRGVIRARRLRDQFFAAELFADPAWDMLLDLMAARLERRQVAVSSLCIAAAVPPTTALRWIKALTEQKLLVRIADPRDGRRVFIELAEDAAAALATYLAAVRRLGLAAI